MASANPALWRYQRTLARIDPTVEAIVADHATSYWGLPVRRREMAPEVAGVGGRVVWSIGDARVLELHVADRGPATLVVHDLGLYETLRKALRTRHVRLEHRAP
jgi:hypothetical protein